MSFSDLVLVDPSVPPSLPIRDTFGPLLFLAGDQPSGAILTWLGGTVGFDFLELILETSVRSSVRFLLRMNCPINLLETTFSALF